MAVPDINRQKKTPATGADAGNQAIVDSNLKVSDALNIPNGTTNTLNGAKPIDGYIRLTNGDLYVYYEGVWKKVGGTADYLEFEEPLIRNGDVVKFDNDNLPKLTGSSLFEVTDPKDYVQAGYVDDKNLKNISSRTVTGDYILNINTSTAQIELISDQIGTSQGTFIGNEYKLTPSNTEIVTSNGYGGISNFVFDKRDNKIYLYHFSQLNYVANHPNDFIFLGSIYNIDTEFGTIEGFDRSAYTINCTSNVSVNNVPVNEVKTLSAKNAANAAKFKEKIRLSQATLIDAIGDSKTYGLGNGTQQAALSTVPSSFTRAQQTYPQALQSVLNIAGVNVQVRNLGYPGDRSLEGINRWQAYHAVNGYPDVAIVNYGTNEVLNTSGYPTSVNIDGFNLNLLKIYSDLINNGVYVVALGNANLLQASTNQQLALYNEALRIQSENLGIPYIDQNQLVNGIGNIWSDGVHLSYQAYGAIGNHLGNYFLNQGFENQPINYNSKYYWYNQLGHDVAAGVATGYVSAVDQSMFVPQNGAIVLPLFLKERSRVYINVFNTAGNYTINTDDINTATPIVFTPINNNLPQRVDLGILEGGRRNIVISKGTELHGWVDEIGTETLSSSNLQEVTDNGNVTTNLIKSTNRIISGTGPNGGFENQGYIGGQNNIWRLSNAQDYGISYYANNGVDDKIGFHFGNRNSPLIYVDGSGNILAKSLSGTGNRPVSAAADGTLGIDTGGARLAGGNLFTGGHQDIRNDGDVRVFNTLSGTPNNYSTLNSGGTVLTSNDNNTTTIYGQNWMQRLNNGGFYSRLTFAASPTASREYVLPDASGSVPIVLAVGAFSHASPPTASSVGARGSVWYDPVSKDRYDWIADNVVARYFADPTF